MPKTKPVVPPKPLDPENAGAVVDEFAKKLAERLLEEGVALEELPNIDERVVPLPCGASGTKRPKSLRSRRSIRR